MPLLSQEGERQSFKLHRGDFPSALNDDAGAH